MQRLSIKIVAFMMWMNATAVLLNETGIAEALGADPQPSAGQKMADAIEAMEKISPDGLGLETLALMYISLSRTFEAAIMAAKAAPTMLANLGVPTVIVAFIFAPMLLFTAIDLIYMMTGREL